MDGFDLGDFYLRYPGAFFATATSTRFGYGMGARSTGKWGFSITPSAEVIFGAAVNNGGNMDPNMYFQGDSGATIHIAVRLNQDGSVQVRRGGDAGAVIASAPAGSVPGLGWHYMECRVIISDTVGVVEVRMDGSSTPVINFSGDTRNGGTSTNIDYLGGSGSGATGYNEWDDMYVVDTLGAINNTFLGDVRVYTLAPNGNGAYSQFVGSDGNSVDNYLLVDEAPYNTADYVGSPTTGQRDSYLLTDLPATVATVFATQSRAIVAKSDAGAASIKQSIRVAATDYDTAATVLSTTWIDLVTLYETNPNTGVQWTAAGVNGAEIGVVVG
jgi:hypothetical protein